MQQNQGFDLRYGNLKEKMRKLSPEFYRIGIYEVKDR